MLVSTVIANASGDDEMQKHGLVDVRSIDSTIVVNLMYAQSDNFVGVVLYTDIKNAYLHPDAARALKTASDKLHEIYPEYNLKVCDAARPMSVQKRMYDKVRNTSMAKYVSNPRRGGGLHNYGLAVDITIVDCDGHELPMGTKVDHLGREANIDKELYLVRRGIITEKERSNRQLLRKIMRAAGFRPLSTEWWHFNLCSRDYAQKHYPRLDF